MASRCFVIWGAAGHALVLNDLISQNGDKLIAFFDNNKEIKTPIEDVPLLGDFHDFKNWIERERNISNIEFLVAIGGARGKDRYDIQNDLLKYGLASTILIHPKAYIANNVELGDGTQVLAQACVAPSVTVGKACIINHRASIDHECVLFNGVHIAPGATLCGCVEIGEFSFIGAGAVILPRVKIGKNSIIGAGSVVIKDVPDFCTVVGNPARIIKRRSL